MKRTVKKKSQKRHSRNNSKARHLQQWVAAKIEEFTGLHVERDGDIESRQMGQSGTDVILRGEALRLFPAAIECGSGESIQWLSKIRQVRENQRKKTAYKFWLVFLKRKEFKTPVVMLDAKTFFDMIHINR